MESEHQAIISAVSENGILITWPEKISPKQHQNILAVEQEIRQRFPHVIIDCIVSYASLMVFYHFDKIQTESLIAQLQEIVEVSVSLGEDHKFVATGRLIEIPVCYDKSLGLDLVYVASSCELSTEEVIHLHTNTNYHAYALGFTAGFCYLGKLSHKLHLPRMASPRTKVPAGAVAIAEQQTAVYPNASPGGWHILGQTPIHMFQQADNQVSGLPLIAVGDTVKFHQISLSEYQQMVRSNG